MTILRKLLGVPFTLLGFGLMIIGFSLYAGGKGIAGTLSDPDTFF